MRHIRVEKHAKRTRNIMFLPLNVIIHDQRPPTPRTAIPTSHRLHGTKPQAAPGSALAAAAAASQRAIHAATLIMSTYACAVVK